MSIKECFVKEFQGHRWCFKKHKYDDKFDMIDVLGEFPTMEISSDMAELLSKQLNLLQQYQNKDKENLLLPNLLLDFVRENADVDKDIIIALIDKMDILMRFFTYTSCDEIKKQNKDLRKVYSKIPK